MATKPPTSLSELMTIRDILMGEIIHEYNERFEKVEADLQAQREALNAKEAALDERIKALDELLQQKSANLATHFKDKMDEDRQSLSALFLSLGQELKR
jgi:Skp family chaperone for outer membrane proteins